MRIDHVLWATHDLDAAAEHFAREYDLHARGGGRHVGMGTHNRIIALGGGYIELIAVADRAEAQASPFGAAVIAADEGLMGWAVAVENVAVHAARLSVPLSAIERDGMTARLAGVAEALAIPTLPFFIERENYPTHPADPSAGGTAGGIVRIDLAGDRSTLNGWLGGGSVPAHVTPGAPAVLSVQLGSGVVIR